MTVSKVVQWDIHASDALAQRRFYADVFGWTCSHPDDPTEYGWMLTPGGRMLGGIGQAAPGESPGIAFFVQIPDVPGTVERAVALGGQVYWGPRTFPDGMVLACIADPAGNGILLIRPSDSGEPYASRPPIDADQWQWEIQSPDPAALAPFYETLFGWTFDGLNEWGWGALRTGPGGGADGALARGDEPRVFFYAPVDDLQAALDRVEVHGGQTAVAPWQVSEDLGIAIFTDPEGNRVGLQCMTAPPTSALAGSARA